MTDEKAKEDQPVEDTRTEFTKNHPRAYELRIAGTDRGLIVIPGLGTIKLPLAFPDPEDW